MTFKGIADPVAVARVVPEGADPVERLRPFVAVAADAATASAADRCSIGAIAVLVAALVVAGLLVAGRGRAGLDRANSVAQMNADGGSVSSPADLGQRPGASAIGFGSLWVAQPDRGVVARVSLDDGSVRDTIRVGNSPAGVAVGEGSVWVTNSGDGTVSRIDPETSEVSDLLRAGNVPTGIAVGDGVLWVADSIGSALLRVDPTTKEVTTVPLAGRPTGVAFTPDGGVGLERPEHPRADRPLGPEAGGRLHEDRRQPADVGGRRPSGRSGSPTSSTGPSPGSMPLTGQAEATIPVGHGPNGLAATTDVLWVANELGDSVATIDPDTNEVSRTIPIGGTAASLATDEETVWLAVGASVREHRGGTLVISTADPVPDIHRPRARLRQRDLADPHVDERRPPRLQEGRGPGRRHARSRPRIGAAGGLARRPHVSFPAARRHGLLDGRADPARGLPPRDRALAPAAPGRQSCSPRSRERSACTAEDADGVRPLGVDRGRRVVGDLPSLDPRPGAPVQARDAVHLPGPRGHPSRGSAPGTASPPPARTW